MGARCGYQRQERVAPSSHIQRKTSSEHEEEKIGLVERLEYSTVNSSGFSGFPLPVLFADLVVYHSSCLVLKS